MKKKNVKKRLFCGVGAWLVLKKGHKNFILS